ncbi:hypothetical protein A2U01_0034871, partial [Trifolium medium]|nr:hypothetical protein [Trifolium medium]
VHRVVEGENVDEFLDGVGNVDEGVEFLEGFFFHHCEVPDLHNPTKRWVQGGILLLDHQVVLVVP